MSREIIRLNLRHLNIRLIFSEAIDSSLSTDMLLQTALTNVHMQFLAECRHLFRLLQTILNGCGVFGINPYVHIKYNLISELRNL